MIGDQAVNAYVEPLVSLDLDLALAVDQVDEVQSLMASHFQTEVFWDTINVRSASSNLRVQFTTEPRYGDFVGRSSIREVLGLRLPVASVEDVLQGRIWAALSPERRATKRRKDLLDIERLPRIISSPENKRS